MKKHHWKLTALMNTKITLPVYIACTVILPITWGIFSGKSSSVYNALKVQHCLRQEIGADWFQNTLCLWAIIVLNHARSKNNSLICAKGISIMEDFTAASYATWETFLKISLQMMIDSFLL